jgi:hypothetical protein
MRTLMSANDASERRNVLTSTRSPRSLLIARSGRSTRSTRIADTLTDSGARKVYLRAGDSELSSAPDPPIVGSPRGGARARARIIARNAHPVTTMTKSTQFQALRK